MSKNDDTDHKLTIDELAQRSGMTVRNIRAHQSRGLLPPPVVRGRTGYYGPEHVGRLETIKDLQADGFNLTAIQRLVEQADSAGQEPGALRAVVLTPFDDEPTEIVDLKELAAEIGVELDDYDKLVKRAEELGFVVPVGGEKFEVISPTIMRAGLEVIKLGVSVDEAFSMLVLIRRHMRAVADAFAKLVDDNVVRPFQDGGYQHDEWPEVQAAIERLRPFATEVALASFKVVMSEAAEAAFGKALARAARNPNKSSRSKSPSKRTPSKSTARRRSSKRKPAA